MKYEHPYLLMFSINYSFFLLEDEKFYRNKIFFSLDYMHVAEKNNQYI